MAGVTLADALQNISGSNVTDRKNGLADLKHILRHNQSNPRVQAIPNKSFLQIFQVLFQAALDGRSALAKAKTSTTRVTAENRLFEIASALRLSVEAGVKTLRLNTVRAVRDHVVETIYLSAGGFCEPLALEYMKCLRTIFTFQPHVEHLISACEWDDVVSFCLDCMKNAESEVADESGNFDLGSTSGANNALSYRSSSRSLAREPAGSQGSRSKIKLLAGEVVACLNFLTAVPNAPLKQQAKDVLWALIEHLRGSSTGTPSNQDAFAAINNVLTWARTENTELTQEVTNHLVRLIRQLWFPKSAALSHMLSTVLLLQPYISRAIWEQAALPLKTDLIGLVQAIKSEYEREHSSTRQLNLEDICLEVNTQQNLKDGKVATLLFTLRCAGTRAETNWLLVYVLAIVYRTLVMSTRAESAAQRDHDDEDEVDPNPRSRKRQRKQDDFRSLIESASTGAAPSRICALQIIAFLAQEMALTPDQISTAVEALSTSSGDEHGGVASWSFVALAACAAQTVASAPSLGPHWISAWLVATRSLSNTTCCRAASYALYIMMQLRLVPQSSVSDLVQLTTDALDLSGPALLSDSVSLLLRGLLRASDQLSPGATSRAAESIINWFAHVYNPSRIQEKDKGFAAGSYVYESSDVLSLISACLGQATHSIRNVGLQVWEGPARAWILCRGQDQLVSYLLLKPNEAQFINPALSEDPPTSFAMGQSTRSSCETQLLSHLVGEITMANAAWKGSLQERIRPSLDIWTMLCKACCVINCVSSCMAFRDARRHQHLQEQSATLMNALCNYIASASCDDVKSDVLLSVWSKTFPGMSSQKIVRGHQPERCEMIACPLISNALDHRHRALQNREDDDAMAVDGEFDSQGSSKSRIELGAIEAYNDLELAFSESNLRSSMALYGTVLTILKREGNQNAEMHGQTAAEVVKHLCTQPESCVLSAREVITALPQLGIVFSARDIEKVLSFLIETKGAFVNNYVYAKSEVALGMILDVLRSHVRTWADESNVSLYRLGLDIYEWCSQLLTDTALSANVQERLADMFLELCHVNPEYTANTDSSADSPLRSVLMLLAKGRITLMFHLSNRISEVFGIFVLGRHADIFEDIVRELPGNTDQLEGISMRLLILSNLGASWHSLLRYCVFYMFEASARVPGALAHASHCIKQLASGLPLKSPQRLFSAFAPQLLHSYISTGESIAKLPFSAFQYSSLADLLKANESEFCSQLVTRSCREGVQTMSHHIKLLHGDMVRRSFAKCMAYAIGRDIAKGEGKADVENILRGLLNGKEESKGLIFERWPAIVGYLYLTLKQEDPEDGWLAGHDVYKFASDALREMKRYSYSTRKLPECQQPSFMSKDFLRAIERIDRRLSFDRTPWNPSSFALASRMILEAIDESLGSLHACLMIRRLRVLICMAGDVAYQGFALEMLIHSLRPFLNDSECADDVLGILQYLFHHGREHLSTNLEFTRGTSILLLLQTRWQSRSKRDRSTQESQHTATLQKMGEFEKWLVQFLKAALVDGATASDGSLIEALSHLQLPSNARRDTPESSFLLFLLDQWRPETRVCSKADAMEAFALFSESFDAPPAVSDDCLGDDEAAVRFSRPLWQVVQSASLSEAFTVWAAQVLGRSYASTGVRPRELVQTSIPERKAIQKTVSKDNIIAVSQYKIASRAAELLFSRNRSEAGLADYCLRRLYELQGAEVNDALAFEQMLPETVVDAVRETNFSYEPALASLTTPLIVDLETLRQRLWGFQSTSSEEWTTSMAAGLCGWATEVPHVAAFGPLVQHTQGLARELLPPMIHILLLNEMDRSSTLRQQLSAALSQCLSETSEDFYPQQQFVLELLLYLRSQPLPNENTRADRHHWLDMDYLLAAEAGARCRMPTSALLLAESVAPPAPHASTANSAPAARPGNKRASTRSSLPAMPQQEVPQSLLLSIFNQVEEPDSFYGVQQPASLDSVLGRLDHESDGFRSLMFRSAQLDSHMRNSGKQKEGDVMGMVSSLSELDFNGLALALLSRGVGVSTKSNTAMLKAAQSLQQWDLNPPEDKDTEGSITFSAFQELSRSNEPRGICERVQSHIVAHANKNFGMRATSMPSHAWYSALASLTEIHETVTSADHAEVAARWSIMQDRTQWMQLARFDEAKPIVTSRQALFSILRRNGSLRGLLRLNSKESHIFEAEALLSSSRLAREHGRLQEALAATTSISNLMGQCEALGLQIAGAVNFETALVLWDAGESSTSVRMLEDILHVPDLETSDIPLGEARLSAQLAHQLAHARLEKPEEILSKYLKPAISHLKNRKSTRDAGKVYYEFATFCDHELQNPGNIENLNRMSKLKQGKEEEVDAIKLAMRNAKRAGGDRNELNRSLLRAQNWLEIDTEELKRLRNGRNYYIHQSLQNYLLALGSSDEHDICVLRFFALWLENSEDEQANGITLRYLKQVPSWKFVLLMNQLMSRAEGDSSTFQTALKGLLVRICKEHPYHSAHHLFAASRRPASVDPAATSRFNAAKAIFHEICADPRCKELIHDRIFRADYKSKSLADLKPDLAERTNKFSASQFKESKELTEELPKLRIPPATMSIELRPSGNYIDVPVVARYEKQCSVMNGNSAPKLATCIASNGVQYKQLFKSGDDLRQDAIMEQVFEEVSKMLRNHRGTRQRDLKVRTYKVVPLTAKSGIIEFVPNSKPLNDFLRPAHKQYYPQDWSDSKARDLINTACQSGRSSEDRIKEFRKICDHIHPVLRYFFFERYHDPDEWFQKRTAYTRTTASISILGHVLGLGDRHNSNIMLDEGTGEVVHIDLGVAFEAGRVLPIPELIPFRLTRDIVDGMGSTGTEGVFRRCCEFTLDAVREDKDSIMTLLNVLRYDPLYSWSVSPLRAKKMQEALESERNGGINDESSSKKRDDEAGEADRALSIVEKKLSKTLSTAAAVNELIQAATDVGHLGTLFHGWAAFY